MMQVYYTERIEGNCHQFEFAPQLRWSVAIDRMELQYNRFGCDVVRNYAEREVVEKFRQTLQELAQDKRENIQFIKVDDLNPKTLLERGEEKMSDEPANQVTTNADRIRNMSNEELAEWHEKPCPGDMLFDCEDGTK